MSARVLFIVSTGRAGSVLMQSLFDSHPDCIGLPGVSPFYCGLFERETFDDADDLIAHLTRFTPARKALLGLPDLALGNTTEEVAPRKLASSFEAYLRGELPPRGKFVRRDAVVAVHRAHARSLGRDPDRARLIVEHLHLASALGAGLADFPDAQCLNMLRDPRAAFYSMHDAILRWFDHSKTRALHAFTERSWLSGWQLFASGHPLLPPERLRHVRLEDLHRRGDAVMRDLAAWLDIRFDETLLQSTIDGVAWAGTDASGKPSSGLSPARAAETAHAAVDAARVEWVLGELIERAGYRRQAPNGLAGSVLGLLALLTPLERELWVHPQRAWKSSRFDDAVETPLVECLRELVGSDPRLRAAWDAAGLEHEDSAARALLRGTLVACLTARRVSLDPWLYYLRRPGLLLRWRRRLRARALDPYTSESIGSRTIAGNAAARTLRKESS